jgi:hypothetical protein
VVLDVPEGVMPRKRIFFKRTQFSQMVCAITTCSDFNALQEDEILHLTMNRTLTPPQPSPLPWRERRGRRCKDEIPHLTPALSPLVPRGAREKIRAGAGLNVRPPQSIFKNFLFAYRRGHDILKADSQNPTR